MSFIILTRQAAQRAKDGACHPSPQYLEHGGCLRKGILAEFAEVLKIVSSLVT